MGNVLGEPFKKYVQEQILQRQEIHGKINRSQKDITYLNSKNAWVKLGSGVSIDEKRMKMLEGNPMAQDVPLGSTLAQNNVLFNGLSNPIENIDGLNKYSKIPRAGVGSDILDNGTSTNNQAYGVGGFRGTNGTFGFSPMPGIIDADLKTLNRGSIKKATVNIKCFNKYQFDVIDVLYLRLGYSIFLEFGSSIYYNSDKELTTLDQSLMSEEYFFSSDYDKSDYSVWLPMIEERRKASGGNYDGMFGVVSNFSWTFGEDGSYNIKLEIISHGDVIESLKVNLPPTNPNALTAQQKQAILKKAKKAVKKFNDSFFAVQTQEEFYTIYSGLKETITEWYNKGINTGDNGLFYTMAMDSFSAATKTGFTLQSLTNLYQVSKNKVIGSNFSEIRIEKTKLPIYTFNSTQIDDNLSPAKLSTEINNIMNETLIRCIKYSYESAALDAAAQVANLASQGAAAFILKGSGSVTVDLGAILSYQVIRSKSPSDDPKFNFPIIGMTEISKTFFSNKDSEDTKKLKGWGNKKEINDTFKYEYGEYDKSKNEVGKVKLLLSYVTLDHILELFYIIAYTKYLKPTFFSDDDVSLGDTDASSSADEDSNSEPSQMTLDAEQKGKNRIREYLYSLRYFDTISGGNLKNQASVRQEFESLKQNEFKKNINKEKERKNELELENIAPTSLDDIVKVTIVNPNINQTTSLNTSKAFYVDNKIAGSQEALKEEKPLPSEQITKNIEEWNNAGLFPEIKNENQRDIVVLNLSEPKYSYFIRLGTFLDFLQEKVIPKIETGNKKGQPLITIDTNPEKNICYVEQNTISFDPRKIILNNLNFSYSENDLESNPPIYKGLVPFQVAEKGYRYGKIMNVYFNFNRIQEIFDDVDIKNNISLFEVIKTLCNDINECLGGLNNLEPVITDETPETDPENLRFSYANSNDLSGNTITFIDQTSIPGIEQIALNLGLPNYLEELYTLDIYGNRMVKDRENPDNPDINSSPFVKNIGLTTQIDKNYATMITIGATANGEIPGENSTAFSKWNVGVIDRFKNNVIDAVAETGSLDSQNETVVKDYKIMTSIENYLGLLGFNTNLTINEDYINTQISTHANYFAYEQAVKTQAEIKKNLSGLGPGSMGFIPFNLKLTLDGISGIKIYNKIKVDTRFLPSNYPSTLKFLVTGIDHSLKDNMWETQLSTVATSAGMGTNESGEEGEYVEAVPYTDEELAEQEANDKEVNTQNIVNNTNSSNQTQQSSKAEKQIKKEKIQKEKESKPQVLSVKEENSQTLGTSSGPITNPSAYKDSTELEAAIKKGLEIIDNITNESFIGEKELRKRIIRIAASYVGQEEIRTKKEDNQGWVDPTYQKMYEELDWSSPKHYCNFSVWLWWYQAFTIGNNYVDSTTSYPNIFDSPLRHSMHPNNIKNIKSNFKYKRKKTPKKKRYPEYQYPGSGREEGFMDPGTVNSNPNFKDIKKWVPIDYDGSKVKSVIEKQDVLPGDAIYYGWAKKRTKHIGIYLCPATNDGSSIWTIEGNASKPSNSSIEGVWKIHRKGSILDKIYGFGQLFSQDHFIR